MKASLLFFGLAASAFIFTACSDNSASAADSHQTFSFENTYTISIDTLEQTFAYTKTISTNLCDKPLPNGGYEVEKTTETYLYFYEFDDDTLKLHSGKYESCDGDPSSLYFTSCENDQRIVYNDEGIIFTGGEPENLWSTWTKKKCKDNNDKNCYRSESIIKQDYTFSNSKENPSLTIATDAVHTNNETKTCNDN